MSQKWFLLAFAAVLMHSSQDISAGPVPEGDRLSPCPSSPNCVSSQSRDESHRVEPLMYTGALAEAKEKLLGILGSMKRVKIVASEGNYVHAEFTSAVLRFVDDAEFLFDEASKTIQVRSASRSGYYDFGVNRRRIESIREAFQGAP